VGGIASLFRCWHTYGDSGDLRADHLDLFFSEEMLSHTHLRGVSGLSKDAMVCNDESSILISLGHSADNGLSNCSLSHLPKVQYANRPFTKLNILHIYHDSETIGTESFIS